MPAATLALTIEQGATWEESFLLKSLVDGAEVTEDLTGYTARFQARSSVPSDAVLLDLSTSNGGIIIDGALGELTLYMSAVQTAAIDWSPPQKYIPASGVYQVELTSPEGVVTRLLKGTITIDPEVVR